MAFSWNSLQIATLAVDALTPVTVAGLGYLVTRASRRLERVQWANQTVVVQRLAIFNEVGPMLNQLLCFATFVGTWKEIQPQEAIGLKRKLDEKMYTNRILFSVALFNAYRGFIATLFLMYAATDTDASLRVPIASQRGDRRNLKWWENSMTELFASDRAVSVEQVLAAYEKLGEEFRSDLYVTDAEKPILNT
jgi:hypothetical protein